MFSIQILCRSLAMTEVIVSLSITAEEYLKHYQGSARSVYAQTVEGRSVRFPANILQPFVTHDGISGTFKIQFNSSNRFKGIKRL